MSFQGRDPAGGVVCVLALGTHRVAGDDGSCQVGNGVQQRPEAGDLVRRKAGGGGAQGGSSPNVDRSGGSAGV